MEDLIAAGVAAIAVSALDPKTQIECVQQDRLEVPLFTFDSDAADAKRLRTSALQHRSRQECRRARRQGHAERRQVHGLRRQHGADNARERIEGLRRSPARTTFSWSMCGPTITTRPAPAPMWTTLLWRSAGYQLHGRLLLVQPAAHVPSRCGKRASSARSRSSRSTRIRSRSAPSRTARSPAQSSSSRFEWGVPGHASCSPRS